MFRRRTGYYMAMEVEVNQAAVDRVKEEVKALREDQGGGIVPEGLEAVACERRIRSLLNTARAW